MANPCTARSFSEAMARAIAAGLTDIRQIKRTVRRRGTWFITFEVSA